jgi:hypothetical protein
MLYEYRNIDTDIELLNAAKLYWTQNLSKQDVYDILANKCYSQWEADKAIDDYYYVHIWSQNLTYYLINTISIILITGLIINLVLKLINQNIFQVDWLLH